MKVQIIISESDKIIGSFQTEVIPDVGEFIFEKDSRQHYKVEEKIFNVASGHSCTPMGVTLWCSEVK